MTELAALIFDVDGTLAETEELHRQSFNETFTARGLGWHWDRAKYAELLQVTGGKERIAHFIASTPGAAPMTAADIADLHREKTALYTTLIETGACPLRPGIVAMLQAAKAAGVRLAVATTTSRPNVDSLLKATLGHDPFEVIAAGDEVTAKKPAPDVYTLALRRLGLPAQACLAVEDTLNGLRSAQGADLACLMTVSAYGGPGPFPGALAVVNDLAGVSLTELQGWFRAERA